MKNKYILFLLEAIFLLSGCCETITPEEAPSLPSVALVQFESWESVTKTSFGEKEAGSYPILWANTDQVGVTVNAANAYKSATVTPSADAHRATFSATLDLPELPYKLQAVSPASAIVAFDGTTSVTLNIPASQNPETNGPDPKAQFLVAETTLDETPSGTVPMHFHHATAYGCLSLTNLPTVAQVLSIDLVFDVPVSGKWDCALSDQIMTPNVPANIITLHTDKATNVFFACAPADLQGTTMKVRLNTEDGIYERTVSISADRSFKQGVVSKFTVDMSTSTPKTSISVLVYGHSYAQDALSYFRNILQDMGYTDIRIGFMMYGNCDLSKHVNDYYAGVFEDGGYYRTINNSTVVIANPVPADVLNEYEWEYVTGQHSIVNQAIPEAFPPYLEQFVDIIRTHRPKAELLWHLMWPHREGDVPGQWNYNSSEMYEAIVSTTLGTVLSTGSFADAIPAGTAIQNLKQTHLGWEAMYRDRIHLSLEYGRFVVGLIWARRIGGYPLQNISYKPGYDYSDLDIEVIKWAAESAFSNPYAVTPYVAPPAPGEPDPGTGSTGGENFTLDED